MTETGRFRGKTVGVFLGGESSEREVSLRTGAAAAAALRRRGYEVKEIDIRGDWLSAVRESGVEVAFLALHGRFGEDGCIQGAMELARIPYTGSGVAASAVSMSKGMTKRVVAAAGVPCPPDVLLDEADPAPSPPAGIGFPLVVKPDREGSTVGIGIVRGEEEWDAAVAEARKFDERVLAEAYVPGREITVGILNGRVLPAIEIVPRSGTGFYDYRSKYTTGQTEYVLPVPMHRDLLLRAAEFTRNAAAALRLRGAARLDYRVDPAGALFFLEANTIPGMTETSLLPKAARFDGLSFEDLVERILEDAGLRKEMLEYKAYHKKSLGKRRRRSAVRRKKPGSGKEALRGMARFRRSLPAAAALLAMVFVGVAGAAVYSWLGHSRLFSVRVVDLNECEHVTRDEVIGMLGGVSSGNIWALSKEEIGKRLKTHPFVREVAIRKAFPDRLIVRITEREPVAMVNLDSLYYVDGQGFVFKRLTAYDSKDYPILTGFSRKDLLARDPITMRNLQRTIALLRRAQDGAFRRNLSEVHFDALEGFTLVRRDDGLQVKIGTMEPEEAMRRIEEALPKLAKLGQSRGIVDLRTEGRIFVRSGE